MKLNLIDFHFAKNISCLTQKKKENKHTKNEPKFSTTKKMFPTKFTKKVLFKQKLIRKNYKNKFSFHVDVFNYLDIYYIEVD